MGVMEFGHSARECGTVAGTVNMGGDESGKGAVIIRLRAAKSKEAQDWAYALLPFVADS